MKHFIVIFFALLLILCSCGKSEKDRVADVLEESFEYLQSDDCKDLIAELEELEDTPNNIKKINNIIEKDIRKMQVRNGFKTESEWNAAIEKYGDDPEIQRLRMKLMRVSKVIKY